MEVTIKYVGCEPSKDEEFLINGGIPSKLNGRPFANNWTEDSKKRGYIYLIDFSGYGKIVN